MNIDEELFNNYLHLEATIILKYRGENNRSEIDNKIEKILNEIAKMKKAENKKIEFNKRR